jgi:hypothetical protein
MEREQNVERFGGELMEGRRREVRGRKREGQRRGGGRGRK